METTSIRPRALRRAPLSTLTTLLNSALIGLAVSLVYAQAVILRAFQPDLTAFAALMLLAAALAAFGWRWAPLLGAALSALIIVGNGATVVNDLTHPENYRLFSFVVVVLTLALVGTLAGVGATVQNYRSRRRTAPRGIALAVATLLALSSGALLVAALPRPASGTDIGPEVLAQLPALTTPGFTFSQTEITVQAGDTVALRLENPHALPHSFDVDALNVHVPAEADTANLILFTPTQPGRYTYYCSVPGHRELGMEGTLIVAP